VNKKAIFDDTIEFIITIIALFFIFIFVSFYLSWINETNQQNANEKILQIQRDQFLLVYARTPVRVSDEYRVMAELASDEKILDRESDEYRAFSTANKQFFDSLFVNNLQVTLGACDVAIVLKKENAEEILLSSVRQSVNCVEPHSEYELIIPNSEGKPVTLRIIFKKLLSRVA